MFVEQKCLSRRYLISVLFNKLLHVLHSGRLAQRLILDQFYQISFISLFFQSVLLTELCYLRVKYSDTLLKVVARNLFDLFNEPNIAQVL